MKVLALDVGEKRIGVAVSDARGIAARGVCVLRRTNLPEDLRAIAARVEELEPARILVGLPVNMDGSEGPMAEKIRGFAARLVSHLGEAALPVLLYDERLSSRTAEDLLRERGLTWKESRDVVDQVAAAAFLQEFLDECAAGVEPAAELVEPG